MQFCGQRMHIAHVWKRYNCVFVFFSLRAHFSIAQCDIYSRAVVEVHVEYKCVYLFIFVAILYFVNEVRLQLN